MEDPFGATWQVWRLGVTRVFEDTYAQGAVPVQATLEKSTGGKIDGKKNRREEKSTGRKIDRLSCAPPKSDAGFLPEAVIVAARKGRTCSDS
ncbi:hypothetical protein NYQ83_10430 [Afifella sp. JA880]|uniref:hypothetical protein n=1 Tax=Afifella sp. JA880 TaxID=2975280 RepID=UPI0021BA8534|nr:hypothetical protein [Afifella sp. JA880]MCT8267687.1 hypothetical protein [Afifella sp. JA880]